MTPQPTRPLIYIIDDNVVNQALIGAVLEAKGWGIGQAASAEELSRLLANALPDLILMDVQLPGTDGLTLTRQLKSDVATQGVPVIALTALAMPGDRERALEAGCDGYITKPFHPQELAQTVERSLVQARQEVRHG